MGTRDDVASCDPSDSNGSSHSSDSSDLGPEGHATSRRGVSLGVILAVFALATILPVSVFSAQLILQIQKAQLAVSDRQRVETARAISIAIDQEVQAAISTLQLLSFLDVLRPNDERLEPFEELALRILPQRAGWHGLLVVDPAGRVLSDTRARRGEPLGAISASWLEVALETGRPSVSNLCEERATGTFYVIVAVPVVRESKIVAVLGAAIRSGAISDVLRRQNPPTDGVVTLLDRTHRIIARTRGEGQYVGQFPTQDFIEASDRMSEGSWDATTLEGIPSYASLSRSTVTGWTVGVGLPMEAIDGPIQRSILALAAGGLGILALGVGAALLLGRLIVEALRTASAAARALAQGQALPAIPSHIAEVHEFARGLHDAASILATRLAQRDLADQQRAQAAAEREAALLAERTAREAREQNEARLVVTLKSIGDAVIATDPLGRITMLNPVAQSLTGWSEAEAMGQSVERVFQIVDEDSKQPIESPVVGVLREARIVAMEHHTALISRDGREIPIEDSAAPIRASDGALLGAVLVFRDVTERREAERRQAQLLDQEQDARREAESLSQSKDEFVATVSHELRSPLNAIFGWVRLLRSGSLEPETAERALDVIERNTRAQAQLIDDLLDMSRIIAGKLRLEMRRLDLVPIVESAIDSVRPTAQAKDVALELDAEPGAHPVLGDADRLQQILWNLLTNAIKFTPQGGRIEVKLQQTEGDVVAVVRDTGIGIAPELLPHIFERFRQGVSSETRAHGGLGIGLALVRNLVELHGGQVRARSRGTGRGATFEVCLPCASRPVAAADALTPIDVEEESHRAGDEAHTLEGMHVLIVDDDADVREILGTDLRKTGARVTPASSVQDAIQVYESVPIDVIVSDIAMPHGSGFSLVKHVRSTQRGGDLPIVALTAYARIEDRERALAAGFDMHVGKPVEPLEFVRIVAAVSSRRRPRAH